MYPYTKYSVIMVFVMLRNIIFLSLLVLSCSQVGMASLGSPDSAEPLIVMPEGLSISVDVALFSGVSDVFEYSLPDNVNNISAKFKREDVEYGFQGAGVSVSVGSNGAFSVNLNTRIMFGPHGYIDVGNDGWASSALGISPRSMAPGKVFSASKWQSALDSGNNVGYVAKNTTFLNSLYYMAPRISYYTAPVSEGFNFGISLGYGSPSTQFVFDFDEFSILHPAPREEINYNRALASIAVLYNSPLFSVSVIDDIGVTFEQGVLRDSVITSDFAVGAKLKHKIADLAVSAGYLFNDPRIYNMMHGVFGAMLGQAYNHGYYCDFSAVRSWGDWKAGLSAFYGVAESDGETGYPVINEGVWRRIWNDKADVAAVMIGAEYAGSVSVVNVIPFVEVGYYYTTYKSTGVDVLNSMGLEVTESFDSVADHDGFLVFFGVKTNISLG